MRKWGRAAGFFLITLKHSTNPLLGPTSLATIAISWEQIDRRSLERPIEPK